MGIDQMNDGVTIDETTKRQKKFVIPVEMHNELLEMHNELRKKKKKLLLFGEYLNFPKSISGNDLDILVDDFNEVVSILQRNGWVIKRELDGGFRAIKLISNSSYLTLDILCMEQEHCKIKSEIYQRSFDDLKFGKNNFISDIQSVSLKQLVKYKAYSYLQLGFVHSRYQLLNLKKQFDNLSESEKIDVIDFFDDDIFCNIQEFFKNSNFNWLDIKKRVEHKRLIRFKDRTVFSGKFFLKNIFKKLVFRRDVYARDGVGTNRLPFIAVIGNDGSGKTTICEKYLKEEFKIDPIHINMRANASWLKFWVQYRPKIVLILRNLNKYPLLKPLTWLLAAFFEVFDFVDKYLRFFIGRILANRGVGVVLFERYPTDRLRGEYYPNFSIFPIEKFFPMPDAFIFFDALPETSLSRKPNDGHTYQEMFEKRQNYIKILSEITRVKSIKAELSLDAVMAEFKGHILELAIEKQLDKDFKPAKWIPDKAARLTVKQNKRVKQKDSFL